MTIKSDLTEKEMEIFNREFDAFAAIQLNEREFIDLYANHRDYILDTLKAAKNQIESEFGGMYCESGQFGWSPVRPDPIISTSKTATINHWNKDITAVGWANWIGSSGSEVKINEEGCLVTIGYLNYSPSPKAVAIKNNIMGTEKPVCYMEPAMKVGDLSVYELPKPFRVLPLKTFTSRVLYNATGRDVLAPVGVYFGTGSHLREESPYPANAT
jgi:hypothetical protein